MSEGTARVRHCGDLLSSAFGWIYHSLGDTPPGVSVTATCGGLTEKEGPNQREHHSRDWGSRSNAREKGGKEKD